MCTSARLFQCARCSRQTLICSHCDRGHQYCSTHCARQARRRSHNQSNRKYSQTTRGKHANAARQKRYRQRQQQKVTDQGSPAKVAAVSSSLPVIPAVLRWFFPRIKGAWCVVCHFCHRSISPLLRHDFLHRLSVYRRG